MELTQEEIDLLIPLEKYLDYNSGGYDGIAVLRARRSFALAAISVL